MKSLAIIILFNAVMYKKVCQTLYRHAFSLNRLLILNNLRYFMWRSNERACLSYHLFIVHSMWLSYGHSLDSRCSRMFNSRHLSILRSVHWVLNPWALFQIESASSIRYDDTCASVIIKLILMWFYNPKLQWKNDECSFIENIKYPKSKAIWFCTG